MEGKKKKLKLAATCDILISISDIGNQLSANSKSSNTSISPKTFHIFHDILKNMKKENNRYSLTNIRILSKCKKIKITSPLYNTSQSFDRTIEEFF